jgi:thiamine-phosphate pyrophosphorylase
VGSADPVVQVPRLTCIVSELVDLTLLPALAGVGVDGFQVRAKEYGGRALCALTERVLGAVASTHARVVVNDRLDVALAVGAGGVHLGATDLPVAAARRLAPDLLIGATCRNRTDVERAALDGADYAGFGPVFATASKSGLPAPLGAGAVTEARGVLPLLAIGGVDVTRAAALVAAGAHGVAVLGAVWRHPDPVGAAKELAAALGG